MPQVAELHAVLQQRVQADLAIPDPSQLTEVSCPAARQRLVSSPNPQLQEACRAAAVDRVGVFATPDALAQVVNCLVLELISRSVPL